MKLHCPPYNPDDPDAGPPKPCWQMKGLLSALSDGTLSGLGRWYAEAHMKGCSHCAAYFTSLKALRHRLRTLGVPDLPNLKGATKGTPGEAADLLSPSRRAALETALANVDSQR